MLQEIQQKAVKINNKGNTLSWGSCLEENTLVLVCGHPSVSSMSGSVLYFVVTDEQVKVTIRSEMGNEVLESINVLIPAQAVDFILKTLKEVFK